MKSKHITIALVALSLVAITFVSTVAAEYTYWPLMYVDKKGKNFFVYIDTTIGGPFDGNQVVKSTIVITIVDAKGNAITINPDPDSVSLTTNLITITLLWKNVPTHALSSNTAGSLTSGQTFFASGPAWGWGAHF